MQSLFQPVSCLSGDSVVRSCDFSLGFLFPLHISAAAAMSQDVEAADGSRLPTAVVP